MNSSSSSTAASSSASSSTTSSSTSSSSLPLPSFPASPDELSPRSLRSSLRSSSWLYGLAAMGSQTPPPTSTLASTGQGRSPMIASTMSMAHTAVPSTRFKSLGRSVHGRPKYKRSLSDPDLKDIKKNVDSQLSAFLTLVANLEVKKEIAEQQQKRAGTSPLVPSASSAAATTSPAATGSPNLQPPSTTSPRSPLNPTANGKAGSEVPILFKLRSIAETFVNTPPDALHSREIVRQIQKLHLNAKSATPLERELMIKLLFIISTCSRLEEYKECLADDDIEVEADDSLAMSSESESEFTSGASTPAVSSPIPMPHRDTPPASRSRRSTPVSRRLSRSLDGASFAAMLEEYARAEQEFGELNSPDNRPVRRRLNVELNELSSSPPENGENDNEEEALEAVRIQSRGDSHKDDAEELKRSFAERGIGRENEKYQKSRSKRSERSPLTITHVAKDKDVKQDEPQKVDTTPMRSISDIKPSDTSALITGQVLSPEPRRATSGKGLSWLKIAVQKEKEKAKEKTKEKEKEKKGASPKWIRKEAVKWGPNSISKKKHSKEAVPRNLHQQLQAHAKNEPLDTSPLLPDRSKEEKSQPSAHADNSDAPEIDHAPTKEKDKSLTPPSVPPLALGSLKRSASPRPDDAPMANRVQSEPTSLFESSVVTVSDKRQEAIRQRESKAEAETQTALLHVASDHMAIEEVRPKTPLGQENDKRLDAPSKPAANDDIVLKIAESERAVRLERPGSTEMNIIVCRICEQVEAHGNLCSKYTKPLLLVDSANKRLKLLVKRLERIREKANVSAEVISSILSAIQIIRGIVSIKPGAENATEDCEAKLAQLRPIVSTLDTPASALSLSSIGVDILNSPRETAGAVPTDINSPRYNPFIVLKAAEREIENKLASLKNLDELRIESPRSLFNSTKSELPNVQDFQFIKPIAKGGYSRVYLARKIKTGDLFAIKVLKKSFIAGKNAVPHILAEKKILETSVSSPFIVKMYYAFQTPRHLFLVMEFLPGGDCYSLLKNVGRFDEPMAKMYIAETVLALEYLHDHGIVHRDLKPDNMLISQAGHIKLTDFGLSRIGLNRKVKESSFTAMEEDYAQQLDLAGEREEEGAMPGTPDYLAPEILLGLPHGKAVDWWALGCVLYEFLIGIPPFCGSCVEEIFQRILSRDIEWPDPGDISKEAVDLIEKLLQIKASERLGYHGASEVKAHAFFADIDWNKVLKMKLKAVFLPRTSHEEDLSYFEARNEDFPIGNDMRELMGRSWEDIDDVPVVGDMDKEARLIGRSPSPVDVDDAFGGFDSVVLGNLLQKNEVAMKNVVRLGSSDALNEDNDDLSSSSDEKA